jgi:hypothetical protein
MGTESVVRPFLTATDFKEHLHNLAPLTLVKRCAQFVGLEAQHLALLPVETLLVADLVLLVLELLVLVSRTLNSFPNRDVMYSGW